MRTRLILPMVALAALAIFAVFAMRPSADSAHQDPSSGAHAVPTEDATSGDAIAGSASHRVQPEWEPDGMIWIRGCGGSGSPLAGIAATWVDGKARAFQPASEAESMDGGWLRVQSHGDDRVLAVYLPGHDLVWLDHPTTDRRHEVHLVPSATTRLVVFDRDSRAPIGNALLYLSRKELPGALPSAGSMPGPDKANAIYSIESDSSGAWHIPRSAPTDDSRYDVVHVDHLLTPSAPETFSYGALGGGVELGVALVAAVQFEGDEMVDGKAVVRHSQLRHRATNDRVACFRRDYERAFENSLIAVFVPEANFDGKVVARASFAHAAPMELEVQPIPRPTFSGPVKVSVSKTTDKSWVTRVTAIGPGDFEPGYPASFPLMITGPRGFVPRVIDFGQDVDLPPGRYRIAGATLAARNAMAECVLDVMGGEPQRLTTEWRKDVLCYDIVVSVDGCNPVAKAQFSFLRADGKSAVVEADASAGGHCIFWLSQELSVLRVFTKGGVPTDIQVGRQANGSRVLHGTAVLMKAK